MKNKIMQEKKTVSFVLDKKDVETIKKAAEVLRLESMSQAVRYIIRQWAYEAKL